MASIYGPSESQNIDYTRAINQTGGKIPTNNAEPMAIPTAPPNIQAASPDAVTEEFGKIRDESPYIAQTMQQPAIHNQWMASIQADIRGRLP